MSLKQVPESEGLPALHMCYRIVHQSALMYTDMSTEYVNASSCISSTLCPHAYVHNFSQMSLLVIIYGLFYAIL